MSVEEMPPFGAAFTFEAGDDHAIVVRHRAEGHWWRYGVSDKNGRRQLVHQAHAPGPGGFPSEATALDAYDAATMEARRRGWVD